LAWRFSNTETSPYKSVLWNLYPILEGSGIWLMTRFMLKIQNTYEQIVFSHVSERMRRLCI
jgi:hypothetical protein